MEKINRADILLKYRELTEFINLRLKTR